MPTRRNHSAAFKGKVALTAIGDDAAIVEYEIAVRFQASCAVP